MGIELNSQQTLTMSSCDLGTKSSLGLNCYFIVVYISTKSDTRSHSASATDAASYPTYVYSSSEYQYTASAYRIASPPSEVRIRNRDKSEGSRNGNLHLHDPISVQYAVQTPQSTQRCTKNPCVTLLLS